MVYNKEVKRKWLEANKERLIAYRKSRSEEIKQYNNEYYKENSQERKKQMIQYNKTRLHRNKPIESIEPRDNVCKFGF